VCKPILRILTVVKGKESKLKVSGTFFIEALSLARRACELTGYKHPGFLATLAVACAAAGRFEEAVSTAQKAGVFDWTSRFFDCSPELLLTCSVGPGPTGSPEEA
jgi:hypothetical protein